MLAVAADLNRIALMDGQRRSASDHRWRLDLSVLLEHPAGGASPWAGWRDDDVPVARRIRGRAGAAASPPITRSAATIFLGYPVHQITTKLRREPVAAFTTIDRFDGTALM